MILGKNEGDVLESSTGVLLSVITPTYNRADLLEETILSIINQSFENWEYIIVDDGSSDETEDLVKKYLNDSRIKYYKHENIGEARTTNRGYKLAKGKFTIVVNADDPLFKMDYFETVLNIFNENPDILAIYPNWVNINYNSEIINYVEVPQYDLLSLLDVFDVTLGPGMVIKKSVLEQIGYRDENIKYTGDLDISYKLAQIGKILHIDVYGATHRNHVGCMQNIASKENIAEEIFNLNLMIFNQKRKNIQKEVLNKRNKIIKNLLRLYKIYTGKFYQLNKLKKFKYLFLNSFDREFLFFRYKIMERFGLL